MKKFMSMLALGALAVTMVAGIGCKAEEKKEGAATEAPKVVEESTATTTTTTTASTPSTGSATTAAPATASTATTTTTTTTTASTAPNTK